VVTHNSQRGRPSGHYSMNNNANNIYKVYLRRTTEEIKKKREKIPMGE